MLKIGGSTISDSPLLGDGLMTVDEEQLKQQYATGIISLDELEGAVELRESTQSNLTFIGNKSFSPINMNNGDTCQFTYDLTAKNPITVFGYRVYVAMFKG